MFTKILVVGVVISLFTNGCNTNEAEWWESMQVYQIYPRSFMDSDGDGIGDLTGITNRLEHVKDTGAAAVWLSPIFPSPMYDFGYDTSDYTTIASEYGTMEDWDALVNKARELGLKVILDFVPNHTSHLHEWFIRSAAGEEEYRNYYVWHPGRPDPNDATNMLPPSNWRSVFRGSAWTWHEGRQEYYLHQFLPQQPDLNYRNPVVVEAMNNVLRYWLDRGASGFRVDAIPHLVEVEPGEDGHYPDEPLSGHTDDEDAYEYVDHRYTRDLEEMYHIVYGWRTVSDEYTDENKVLMTEAMSSTELVMKYFGNETSEGAHIPFNFNLAYLNNPNAQDIKNSIDDWFNHLPEGRGSNWVVGNHDQPRLASRYGEPLSEGVTMIKLLLPGVGVTYQGEEIAMTDQYLSFEDTMDPQACKDGPESYSLSSRDPARTPFHWDASPQAGFSTNPSTWLPVADNYRDVNLDVQIRSQRSHYHVYKEIAELRYERTFVEGDVDVKVLPENVLGFTRTLAGESSYVILVNMSPYATNLNLLDYFGDIPQQLFVEISSRSSGRSKYDEVDGNDFILTAYESIVLTNGSRKILLSTILAFASFLIHIIRHYN